MFNVLDLLCHVLSSLRCVMWQGGARWGEMPRPNDARWREPPVRAVVRGSVKFWQRISLFDAIAVVLVAIIALLPRAQLEAVAPTKAPAADAIAWAEARALSSAPGRAPWALETAMVEAGHRDVAVAVTDRIAHKVPTWPAALSAAIARADVLDAKAALTWTTLALERCGADATCAAWDKRRIDSYRAHLEAGVKSGIDPKVDPNGFRRAGEAGMRMLPL